LRRNDETRGEDESFGGEVSGNASLYRGNWKLVRTALPRGDFTWRLFDLSVDPGETTDLSGENPELFAEMRAEYEAYVRDRRLRPRTRGLRRSAALLEPTGAGDQQILAVSGWPRHWRSLIGLYVLFGLSGWWSAARRTDP
jgi:hypothetical protein